MKERIDRIDERGSRMAAEIHDERTARESAQRLIASQAHDTHRSIYELRRLNPFQRIKDPHLPKR